MTEDPNLNRDGEDDDVTPRHWIDACGLVKPLQAAEHAPTEPAADTLNTHRVKSRSPSQHIVVTSVDPRTAQLLDEPAKLLEVRKHIGPFPDRRSAERWARGHYADKPSAVWTTAHVREPACVKQDVRRLRA